VKLKLLLFVVLAACSQGPTCRSDLPVCPATPPSYANDVAPLIQADCYPCHGPGGSESNKTPLSSYSQVFGLRGSVLTQIYQCKMPPTGALGDPDRQTILEWLECNAPNN
jgi:hypothetical protein